MRKGGLAKVGERAEELKDWDFQARARQRDRDFDTFDESDPRTTDWTGNVTGEDDQAYFEANGMGD